MSSFNDTKGHKYIWERLITGIKNSSISDPLAAQCTRKHKCVINARSDISNNNTAMHDVCFPPQFNLLISVELHILFCS